MRIRFTQTVQAETEGRHKGPVYKAGTELVLSEASAQRWLRRGVAVEATEKPKSARASATKAPEKAAAKPAAKPKADD